MPLEGAFAFFGGERGIRTPGPLTVNGFQDRRIRPLCHLSAANVVSYREMFKKTAPFLLLHVSLQKIGICERFDGIK